MSTVRLARIDIEVSAGELVTLPFAVLPSQYPDATTFGYEFQVTDQTTGAALFTKAGSVTVAGSSFDVPLSTTDTDQAVATYSCQLWDTTNNRCLGAGTFNVTAGLV